MRLATCVAITFLAMVSTGTVAQTMQPHGAHGAHGTPAKGPATAEYAAAMDRMMARTQDAQLTGDASRDFVLMMRPHHEAAVEMAQSYLKYGHDPVLTRLANEIIAAQNREIQELEVWTKAHAN